MKESRTRCERLLSAETLSRINGLFRTGHLSPQCSFRCSDSLCSVNGACQHCIPCLFLSLSYLPSNTKHAAMVSSKRCHNLFSSLSLEGRTPGHTTQACGAKRVAVKVFVKNEDHHLKKVIYRLANRRQRCLKCKTDEITSMNTFVSLSLSCQV